MKKIRNVIIYKDYFEEFFVKRVVVLLSGFQKKDQKTPISEIEKAKRIMNEYYNEKKGTQL